MTSTNDFVYDSCSNDDCSIKSVNSEVITNDTINEDSDSLSEFLEILNEYDNNPNNNIDIENNNIIDNEQRIKEEKKEIIRKRNFEYYHKVGKLKTECKFCGCIVEKDSLRKHYKTTKCLKLRENFKSNENDKDNGDKIKIENAIKKKEKSKEYNRIYHLKYYHENENIRVECEYCKCIVTKAGMKKHINTEKCINIREKITIQIIVH